jgi:hypothetical protein
LHHRGPFALDAFGTVDYDNTFTPVALPNALPKASDITKPR